MVPSSIASEEVAPVTGRLEDRAEQSPEVEQPACNAADINSSGDGSIAKSPRPKFFQRPFWRGVRQGLITNLVLWVIYSLSIGPMYWQWYWAMYGNGPRWVAKMYFPLLLVCESIPWYGRLINWYLAWWVL